MATPQPTAAAARARSWRWLAIAVVSAAVLAGALAVALPRLIDSAVVKGEVERRVSELTGGSVRYDAVSLRAFPWPRAGFVGVTLNVREAIEGRIPQLEIDLALLPLLTGNARVTAIRASEPAMILHLPPGPGGDPMVAYRAGAGPIVAALKQSVPGATISIAGGRLDVVAAGRPVASLANLDVTATVSDAAIDVQANCTGELWRSLRSRLSIVPDTLKASLQLDVSGADATALFAMLSAQGPLAWRGGAVDATVEATTDGQRALRGHLNAATPQLMVTRGERELVVGASRVALTATRDDERLAIALEELQLGDLVPAATGALRVRLDGGSPALDLQVPAVDVARLHAALATLTGDAEAMRAMAAAVPAGSASGLTLAVAAADFSGFGEARAIRIDARLDGATVRIPAVDVTATEVAGRLVVAAGELTATGVAGVLGNGSFRDATLALALAPAVSLRQLKADLDVDLAQALPVVRRILGPGPHPVLDDVETLAGRGVGTVIHDARDGRPRTTFDITSIAGQARDRRLPFPLDVQAGALRYTGDRLTLRGMSGRFGGSQVTQAGADFALGARAQLAGATGDFVVVLDEIYPWLASLRPSPAALRGVERATGTAGVHVARLAGNLEDIDALDFDVVVAPTRLRIVASALPGPLTLDGGSAAITPQRLALDRVRASLLDGSVIAAGSVDDYTSAAPRIALALTDAAAGDAAIEWARARFQLPLRTVPRAPLRISDGQVAVSGAGRGPWALQGALALAGEARAEFDLEWRDESLDLRRFALRDAWSNVTVSFKRSGRSADIAFSGNVDNRTFERVLLHPPALQGELRGNFRATVDLDEPQRTSATGTLDAEGTDLLERWGVPATIERLHLVATGSAARVSDTAIVIDGQKLALAGTVERRQSTYALDAQVTADDLDLARLAGALRPAEASATPPGRAGEWNLPVEGRVTLAAASVTFDEGTVRSVAATASLSPKRVAVDVTDVRWCGIALPFTAVLTSGHAAIEGKAQARGQALAPTISCLAGEPIEASGTFDFDATFAASGPPAGLRDALQGSFQLTARAGRIRRLPVVSRILSVGAVAERTHESVAAEEASTQPDSRIAVAGTVKGNQVRIDRATLDKPFLGIAMSGEALLIERTVDLQGLVAPLTPINEALRNVPIVGELAGATIIGIPLRVTGTLQDPTVALIGPGAVGRGVVELMAATLKAPVELLDPLLGARGTP